MIEDPGHDRKIREMAGKKRLIHGDILNADDAIGLQLLNAVHQQHGIAVREDVADRLNIHDRHAQRLL